jgi:Putative transposase/Transposase zinc-binding domain
VLELADVLRCYGDAYLRAFGSQMLPSHLRAFHDILHCRTAAMGGQLYVCDQCGYTRYVYHSCKNRCCPKCQADDTEAWLAQRRQELVAAPYFHLVFTVPKALHDIFRRHQKTLYAVLMKAAAHSLMKLADDPRYVGARIGIMAVLHTWTRTMSYHPHVHCLVPAGGVSDDGYWVPARKDYLVPVKALSPIFRAIFIRLAQKALPQQQFPAAVWTKRWWIDCRPTVYGTERILQYLARYVHRVAFSNSRLISIEAGRVTFRYQKCGERQWRIMSLAANEFIRRFLQHVLPRGTHKVRYYGFWNPVHRQLLRRIQLAMAASQIPHATEDKSMTESQAPACDDSCENPTTCPQCKRGILVLVATLARQPRPPPW